MPCCENRVDCVKSDKVDGFKSLQMSEGFVEFKDYLVSGFVQG
jgi:hypothetical protein